MTRFASALTAWTTDKINDACRASYAEYERELKEHYTRYFADRPHLRCKKQLYSAASIALALPPDWSDLQDLITPSLFHRYARSGRSSQIIALSLLGSAARADETLNSFWKALDLPFSSRSEPTKIEFERSLDPEDLQEEPRVTTLDCVLTTPTTLAVVEAKWSESGLGTCSCLRDGDGNPDAGFGCAARINRRNGYWRTAFQDFGLAPYRIKREPCPVSLAYQAIRNVAAARVLAGGRRTVFVLLFDDLNPYFAGCGDWPGWPSAIQNALGSDLTVHFRAISWRQLMRTMLIPRDVLSWASEKHRL